MTKQEIEKYVNTPIGLAFRELVDPLIESGEVVLANMDTVDSDLALNRYLGTDTPSLPYQTIGCGCLLGTAVEALAQAGSGVRPIVVLHPSDQKSATCVLARAFGISYEYMLAVEAGFENRSWILSGIEAKFFNVGRALALHYGLL